MGIGRVGNPSDTARLVAIAALAVTDRKVRAHEQAHLSAAGPYSIGAPSYTYQLGPDGQLYAVGGEVSMDVSPDPSDPERTIEKAKTIQAAANAPADPSSQDRMVAAAAAQMEATAERDLASRAYSSPDAPAPGQMISVLG